MLTRQFFLQLSISLFPYILNQFRRFIFTTKASNLFFKYVQFSHILLTSIHLECGGKNLFSLRFLFIMGLNPTLVWAKLS